MAKVTTDNIHYKNIAKVLRSQGKTDASFTPSEMPEQIEACCSSAHTSGYNSGLTDGKELEYNEFWDKFQNYGNRINYISGFSGIGWTAVTFRPKYSIIPVGNCNSLFQASTVSGNLKDILAQLGIVLDLSKVTRFQYGFGNTKFTHIGVVDLSNTDANTTYVFNSSSNLVSIEKLIVSENTKNFNNWFYGCTALTDIAVEGTIARSFDIHWSTGLTMLSLASIIGALSKTVTGQTVTFPETARETYDNATISGRWDELVAEYPNWTFAYA